MIIPAICGALFFSNIGHAEDSWIEPEPSEIEPGPFAEEAAKSVQTQSKKVKPETPPSPTLSESSAWEEDEKPQERPAAAPSVKKAAPAGNSPNSVAPKPSLNQGRILNPDSMVYQSASFDAKVLATLEAGGVYSISSKIIGPFYKIKVKEGVYGYIADTDVKPLSAAAAAKAKSKNGSEKKSQKQNQNREQSAEGPRKSKKAKPFEMEKFRGAELSQIYFREDTMGLKPTDSLTFFGFKASGPDILVEGSYIDANILFHYGAPKYYEQATGRSADGFILLMNFLFEMESRQGPNTVAFYGMGPLFKYSKFSTGLKVGSKEEANDLIDMTVGTVFNLGFAQRFESFALRGELQYFWEKMQYMGFAVSAQVPF